MGRGEDAIGGLARGAIRGAVVDGGETLGAHLAVEPEPFGAGQMALGLVAQGAAESCPCLSEAFRRGIKRTRTGDESGLDGVG